jgi:cysteine synthase A
MGRRERSLDATAGSLGNTLVPNLGGALLPTICAWAVLLPFQSPRILASSGLSLVMDRARITGRQEAVMGRVQSRLTERASWLMRLPLETPTIPFEDVRSGCTLWLKLDYLLPSGCTKDRMATSIVAHAIASGEVSTSTVVVEASSGSTSIALSMVCATVGVPFRAYMPKTVSGERVLMIRRLGGDVVLTPAGEGMNGAVAALLHDAGTEVDLYAARQFENPRNVFAHQHSTGPELIQQVGVRLDGFVAGVGTGGTLMGVARALRDHGHDTVIAQAMPAATFTAEGAPEVVGGIPGIVEGMSRLLDPDAVGLDDAVLVPETEAIATTREFGRRGLGIGPSSGLNIAAARRLAARLGPGHHVGTVLPDRMERYFSTALFDDVAAEL